MNIMMIGAAMLAGVMVTGCGKSEQEQVKKDDTMAVSVNGEKLMQSAIDADVEKIVKSQGNQIPPDRLEYAKQSFVNQIVQGFIIEKVLGGKAKAAGITITDEDRKAREAEFLKATEKIPDAPKSAEEFFKKFPLGEARGRAEFENGILFSKLIKAEMAKASKKDYAAEAKKVIDNIVSNNAVAKVGEAESLKKIAELKAQLDKITSPVSLTNEFAKLARENSACPSSQRGGDLGEFTHGQMVPEFDEVAFKLPVNKVSEPVKTQFGYHILLVTKKTPAVEAKGETPAEPEKVQASHILLKTTRVQDVPTVETVISYLEKQDERTFSQKFIQEQLKAAKIEATEAYKRFLPPSDKPTCEAECECEKHPVEKPAQK